MRRILPTEHRLLEDAYWKGLPIDAKLARIAAISEQNIQEMYAAKRIDVYCAASTNNDEQYRRATAVFDWLQSRPIAERRFFFEPFNAVAKSGPQRSSLEEHALEKATALVVVYGTRDATGMNSEVAQTLLRGKQAILHYNLHGLHGQDRMLQLERARIKREVDPRRFLPSSDGSFRVPHVTIGRRTLERCLDRILNPYKFWSEEELHHRSSITCPSCRCIIEHN